MKGYGTLTKALSMTVLLIALFPEVQAKVYEELQKVFDSDEQEATTDHLQQLTYLDMVVKESMRFWPIIPYIIRYTTADTSLGKIWRKTELRCMQLSLINFKVTASCQLVAKLLFQ